MDTHQIEIAYHSPFSLLLGICREQAKQMYDQQYGGMEEGGNYY
jgi:hypothetical protein